MEVSDVTIIVLVSISCLFFVFFLYFICIVLKTTIRRRYRSRHYHSKYIAGKTKAYFDVTLPKNGLPISYPKAIQGDWRGWHTKQDVKTTKNIGKELTTRCYSFPSFHVDTKSFRQKNVRKKNQNNDCTYVFAPSDLLSDFEYEMPEEHLVNFNQTSLFISENNFSAGILTFALEYIPETLKLVIVIKQAFDLRKPDLRKPDFDDKSLIKSYVMFCLIPEDFPWQRTETVNNNNNPIFNQTFTFPDMLYHTLRGYNLMIFVMDVEKGEKPIGKIMYPLNDITQNVCVNITKELEFT